MSRPVPCTGTKAYDRQSPSRVVPDEPRPSGRPSLATRSNGQLSKRLNPPPAHRKLLSNREALQMHRDPLDRDLRVNCPSSVRLAAALVRRI